jgi:hypothetical protein
LHQQIFWQYQKRFSIWGEVDRMKAKQDLRLLDKCLFLWHILHRKWLQNINAIETKQSGYMHFGKFLNQLNSQIKYHSNILRSQPFK